MPTTAPPAPPAPPPPGPPPPPPPGPPPWAPPPPPPPAAGPVRPPLPPAPLPVLGRALAAGLLAATLVPDHRLGVGTVVTALGIAAAAPPGARLRTPFGAAFGAVAVGLVLVAVLRDAAWLLSLCVLGAAASWSLLLSGADGWVAVVRGAVAIPLRWWPAAPWLARAVPALLAAERRSALLPVLRGAGVAAALLVVFGALFATADAAFGELLGRLVPPAPGDTLVARTAVALAVAVLVGAAVRVASAPPTTSARAPYAGRVLRPVEWVLPLVLLDLLFAAFVAVQLTVLFGGRAHVLATSDLTYAEHAREGFGQLVAAAVLTLGVIAVASRLAPSTPGSRRLRQVLLGVLCLLTLVVLASASRRLGLYEQQYGFTRLRLSVDGAIGWLAVVLLLVLGALTRPRAVWLPRALALSAAVGLLVFALADPDARIAERNVERFVLTGDLDGQYLAELSADAVPALDRLPEPQRSCVLGERSAVTADSRIEANLSRARAGEALRERPIRSCPPGTLVGAYR